VAAWPEAHGWPLSALLRGLRATGRRLALEHSILIADRIAAGLESAQKTRLDQRPVLHGLVWPGFVSIGEHGDVRIGGFGVAPGILPALEGKRLADEVAPYLAPEERSQRRVGVNSDVYSLGVILLELLTGRQPREEKLRPDLRREDAFPAALVRVLRVCFAPAELRFPSLSSFRRELGKVVVGASLELSSYRLAADLGGLCNQPVSSPARAGESGRDAPTDAEIDRTLDDLWKRLNV
jgi:serine/threonine protein kinase